MVLCRSSAGDICPSLRNCAGWVRCEARHQQFGEFVLLEGQSFVYELLPGCPTAAAACWPCLLTFTYRELKKVWQ